jgi:hypothetical protein
LSEWNKILKINYWPIFDIARRILEHIPTADSKPLVEHMAATADRLLENHLMRSHDPTPDWRQKIPRGLLHDAGIGGPAGGVSDYAGPHAEWRIVGQQG